MSWSGHPATNEAGAFLAAQVANALDAGRQNDRAARIVAGRATDAADCAEMLAMLGLVLPGQRRPDR